MFIGLFEHASAVLRTSVRFGTAVVTA